MYSYTYIGLCNEEIRRILFMKVPETRKALMLLEMDRVAQVNKLSSPFFIGDGDIFHINLVGLLMYCHLCKSIRRTISVLEELKVK